MPLPRFELPIPQESYSVADPEVVLAARLGSGQMRTRLDMIDAPVEVDLSLVLEPLQFLTWRMFFRSEIAHGTLPFLIDLMVDDSDLIEHEVRIVPGSHRLGGLRGDAHMVQMRLEVKVG